MKKVKRILCSVIGACMLAMLVLPFGSQAADTGNAQVKEACKGVVQILVTYVDSTNTEYTIQSGSGFFIGSEAGADTIVTNHHVIAMDAETQENAKELFGRDISNDIQIKVVVDRDVTKTATVGDLDSADYDITVLKLDEPLSGMNILPLSTEEPDKTQTVYALGFPDTAQLVKDKQFYTSDEVTINSGTISGVAQIGQTDHIQHECTLSSGNSGGPLVDESGAVIGVNRAGIDDKYYYAVKVSELTKLLDKMSISYNTTSGTVGAKDDNADDAEAEAEKVDKSALQSVISSAQAAIDKGGYTDDSVSFLEAAVADGKKVIDNADATQAQVDSAVNDIKSAQDKLAEKKGLPIIPIAVGAVVVVVIIIVIVVVATSSKKKKAKNNGPVNNQMPYNNVPQMPNAGAPQQPVNNGPQQAPQAPYFNPGVPPVDMGGSDETSVLNEGAGQTTVLSSQAVPTATLRRVSNGETAIINKPMYLLGKEKSKVDFCISNNSSVSRVHAKITFEGGAFYIEDQNATNFTFVNGNKVNPGQKVKIANGDKIKLSDEEFEFKA